MKVECLATNAANCTSQWALGSIKRIERVRKGSGWRREDQSRRQQEMSGGDGRRRWHQTKDEGTEDVEKLNTE